MNGTEVLVKEISTAGEASQLSANADRININAGGEDLAFITIDILDKDGNLVPQASKLVSIKIKGDVTIAGVDNGSQTSHEPFQSNQIRAFNGKCLVIIRSGNNPGKAEIILSSDGFADQFVEIEVN
jgi:beta-galactosidase